MVLVEKVKNIHNFLLGKVKFLATEVTIQIKCLDENVVDHIIHL